MNPQEVTKALRAPSTASPSSSTSSSSDLNGYVNGIGQADDDYNDELSTHSPLSPPPPEPMSTIRPPHPQSLYSPVFSPPQPHPPPTTPSSPSSSSSPHTNSTSNLLRKVRRKTAHLIPASSNHRRSRTTPTKSVFDSVSPISPQPLFPPRMCRSSSLGALDVSPHYSLASMTSPASGSCPNPTTLDDARFSPRRHHRHPLRKRIYSFDSTKSRARSWWLIPSDSPWKMLWDMTTFLITLYSFYLTNISISTRSYEIKESSALIELWFLLDVAISFVTEHVSSTGERTGDGKKVVLRYLKTWFIVDILSMIPWETFILKPIVDMQNNRGFFSKSFFRTKGVVKVTRVLRGRHFKLFGKLSRKTKHVGFGASKLLKSLIKYLPKYIMFMRRMKIIIPLRIARGYHVMRKLAKDFFIWGGQVKRDVGGRVRNRRERIRESIRDVGGRWSPVRDARFKRGKSNNGMAADTAAATETSSPPPLSIPPPTEERFHARRRTVADFAAPPPSPHTVNVPKPKRRKSAL